jgi:hypothetical protein
MCNPASFVLTKDQIFWSSKHDNHTDIIKEHNLCPDGVRGPNIVAVEIRPPRVRFDADTKEWVFKTDQDPVPDWYDPTEAEARTRLALVDWLAGRVFTSGEHTVASDKVWAYGNAQVKAHDNAEVIASDNAVVTAYGNAKVTAYGNGKVEAGGDSQVMAVGDTEVTAHDNAKVIAYGNAKVTAYDDVTVTANDNSQIWARGHSQIWARYNAKVWASGYSTVTTNDNSTVMECNARALVQHYAFTEPCKPTGQHAVVIDQRGQKAVCIVGE